MSGVLRQHPQDTVVVVGHAFVLTSILVRALGLGLGNFRRLRMDAGSISILQVGSGTPQARLLLLNDTCPWRE